MSNEALESSLDRDFALKPPHCLSLMSSSVATHHWYLNTNLEAAL